jgi:transcriptional regulator with XRE-family HTH domain
MRSSKMAGGKWGDEFRARLRLLVDEDTEPSGNQRAFAKRVGVAETLAGNWLGGSRLPSAESLRQIFAAYSTVSADWLMLGNDPRYRGQSRTAVQLEADLAQAVARGLMARFPIGPRYKWDVTGPAALAAAIDALALDARGRLEWHKVTISRMRDREAVLTAIDHLVDDDRTPSHTLKQLHRVKRQFENQLQADPTRGDRVRIVDAKRTGRR